MIDTVQSLTTVGRPDDNRRPKDDTAPPDAAAPPSPAPAQQSDVRLLIEQSKLTGVYVYTLIDRTTGRVLTSIPREEVEAMGRSANYVSGAVASTKA